MLIACVLELFSMFLISDYIPSLSSVPKWQGIHKMFEKVQKSKRTTLRKMLVSGQWQLELKLRAFWLSTNTTSSTLEWAMVELILAWWKKHRKNWTKSLYSRSGTRIRPSQSPIPVSCYQRSTTHGSHCTSLYPSSISQCINCLRV